MDGQPYTAWTVQDSEMEVATEIGERSFQIIEA
jgi:hypothetical protein